MGVGDIGVYEMHALIRTDRGTFHMGSNSWSLNAKEMEKEFTFDQKSFQINAALNSLLLAKAWLGNLLGLIGEETPYANDGKRSDIKDIEPTADVSEITLDTWASKNHIEKVDWLREKLKKISDDVIKFIPEESIAMGQSKFKTHEHLCEARFHLGFELQRIKEAKA